MAPWMAAPRATASSGLTFLAGSLPKSRRTSSWIFGMRVWPPTRSTSPSCAAWTLASPRTRSQTCTQPCTRSAVICSSWSRESVDCKCSGPLCGEVEMKGRLISTCFTELSSHFAFSAASRRRCSAILSLRRSVPCFFWNGTARSSMMRASKSSPPSSESPPVASTSKTPLNMCSTVKSKVPPPRSNTATCRSLCALPKP